MPRIEAVCFAVVRKRKEKKEVLSFFLILFPSSPSLSLLPQVPPLFLSPFVPCGQRGGEKGWYSMSEEKDGVNGGNFPR